MKFCDLKNGETFKLTKNDKDKRVFRKEKEGALQIKDVDGFPCENHNFMVYPYLTMPVFKTTRG